MDSRESANCSGGGRAGGWHQEYATAEMGDQKDRRKSAHSLEKKLAERCSQRPSSAESTMTLAGNRKYFDNTTHHAQ
jgi:hypothetical protein